MIETDITIESDGASLSGTLCLPTPNGSFPTVLMIHGSGPLDRDENSNGQTLDIFNTIARALADAGVASVRYDKRGCYDSTGDYFSSSQQNFINDAVKWVEELHRKDFCRANKIFLLGHSEGTIIAPQVHNKSPVVAGLILLCPFVTELESVLLEQAVQLDKEIANFSGWIGFVHGALRVLKGSHVSQQIALIQKIKASGSDTIRVRGQKIPAKWFRELFDLNLPDVYRRIACPTLLIGGEKDLQCDPKDVLKIAVLCGAPLEVNVLPDLTHVLRFDDQEPALTRTHELLVKPMEGVVTEVIIDWLSRSNGSTS